jgi:glycosyltransferase involved in cell wall biosynthesis
MVIADSEFLKQQIITKFKIAANKIEVVYHVLEETLAPLQLEEREKFKEHFAGGNEYFFAAGKMTDEVLLDLLKAFSLFKKRQKSSMQLIIASQDNMSAAFLEKLRLYKFKEEVKINNASEENFSQMLGATYAFIFSGDDYFYVLQAMQMNVPVLLSANGKAAEITGNAAMLINIFEQNTIAEKIMLIFKDEKSRRELIEKGKEQIKQYSCDKSATSLWKSIEKAVRYL